MAKPVCHVAFLWLCLLATGPALAQMERDDPRRIPYTGRLESSGAPAQGAYDFRFALFAGANDVATCLGTSVTGCGLWAEEQTAVPVSSGQFAVVLGSNTPLQDAVLASPQLFLAIAVKGPSDAAYAVLVQKQQVIASPLASRAAAANNYKVTGILDARGDARLVNSSFAGVRVGNPAPPAPLAGADALYNKNDAPADVGISAGNGGDVEIAAGTVSAMTVNASGVTVKLPLTVADVTATDDPAAANTLLINGRMRMTCPPNMTRLGAWCIDNTRRAPADYDGASSACHAVSANLCGMDALLLCDGLEPTTSDCTVYTDGNNPPLWTSWPSQYDPTVSVYSQMSSFNPDDNSFDRTSSATPLRFYCCVPGYWQ